MSSIVTQGLGVSAAHQKGRGSEYDVGGPQWSHMSLSAAGADRGILALNTLESAGDWAEKGGFSTPRPLF